MATKKVTDDAVVAPVVQPEVQPFPVEAPAAEPAESPALIALRAIKARLDALKRQFDAGSKSDIDAGGAALGAISVELQAAIDAL